MNENISDKKPDDGGREDVQRDKALSLLFGPETVEQARLIDVVDLNLNESMIECISKGVTTLKQLRGDPGAQRDLIRNLSQGERLLLCMWIMEMDLLGKIRERSD
jgi:hypothetical protein